MTAPTSPGTAARKRPSASKTDDPKVSVFHVKQSRKDTQAQPLTTNEITGRIATWSRASSKSWRTRKRMAEARSRPEYEAAAEELEARLLAAEDKGK